VGIHGPPQRRSKNVRNVKNNERAFWKKRATVPSRGAVMIEGAMTAHDE
jgi:hypothetical protein